MTKEVPRLILLLDSWPVLEWIKRREPAYSRFHALLIEGARTDVSFEMCRINYGEVLHTIRKAPDTFAAALAIRLDVELATGDREFRALEANGLLRLRWVGA